MSISGTVKLSVATVDTGSPDFDDATLVDPLTLILTQVFTDGVGADQINYIWHDRRTLAGSTSETLDLADPANTLVNYRGEALNLARVKLLVVRNRSTVNSIQFGPPISGWIAYINVVGTELILPPESWHIAVAANAAGWAVTGGTGDRLLVENLGGTSTDYDIIIGGGLT